jgi:hypothetical protein
VEITNNDPRGLGRGRKRPEECAHAAPILMEGARFGYGARCLLCGTVYPARERPEGAKGALQTAGLGRSVRETGQPSSGP